MTRSRFDITRVVASVFAIISILCIAGGRSAGIMATPLATTYIWNGSTTTPTTGSDPNIASVVFTDPAGNDNQSSSPMIGSPFGASNGYAGASGAEAFRAAARGAALNKGAGGSAYFEVTLTPASGYKIDLTSLSFGLKSNGTGPTLLTVLSSIDNYTTPLTTDSAANDSAWHFKGPYALTGATLGTGNSPVVLRIYGSNGIGSSALNYFIDDITLTATAVSALPPPSVTTTTPLDNASNVPRNQQISINFDQAMNPASITVQSTSGACSGSLQVSKDNFTTCVGMGSVAASSGNTVFASTPTFLLEESTTYKIRVTTAAQSSGGTGATAFTQTNGFTTVPPCATQPSGMVSWYKGESNALDQRGNHNGTLQGGATFGPGEVGQGFSFDGNGDYVSLPGTFGGTAEVTFDAWVKTAAVTPGVPGIQTIIGNLNEEFIHFHLSDDNTLKMAIYTNAGGFLIPVPGQSPTGQWRHIALTTKPGEQKVYIDGIEVGATNFNYATLTTSSSVMIGAGFNNFAGNPARFFNGSVDEVEIFSRALTGTEIQAIYNAGALGKCTCTGESGPVGWWPGDGDFRDVSGNNNNGTGVASPSFVVGKVSQAFSFNGASHVVVADPIPANLQVQNEISLEAWIYATGLPTGADQIGVIMGSQFETFSGATIALDGRSNPDLQTAPPGHIHFQIGGNNDWHVTNTNSAVPLNQWVHIVATRKANEDGKVYFNGVLQPSTSAPWNGTISYANSWFAIGQQKDRNRPFPGMVDEASIYSRAISANEVLSTFNAGLAGKYKSATTPTGTTIVTNVGSDATVTFGTVLAAGTTQQVPIDLSTLPALPSGHTSLGLTYDIATAATHSGATVCFNLPYITSPSVFNAVRVDHLEGGVWVNRTNNATINIPARTVCTVGLSSLSPFAIVQTNAPTAANVSLGGRVTTADGRGLRNAVVTLSLTDGKTRSVKTGAMGSYSFENVPAGHTVLVGVAAKRYVFIEPLKVIHVHDSMTDVSFRAAY